MTIKFLNLSITTLFLRFYLMMAVVIAAGFSGVWALGLLALPIFVSIMLGVSFQSPAIAKSTDAKMKTLKTRKELEMVG